MNNPIRVLEQLIYDISHDTYILTRDDIDAIEWRLQDVKRLIDETYQKRGKSLK